MGVMPNHWRKCNICSRFGVQAGSVVLTGFLSFVKPTKTHIVMKKFNVGRLSPSAWSVTQFNKHLLRIYVNPTSTLRNRSNKISPTQTIRQKQKSLLYHAMPMTSIKFPNRKINKYTNLISISTSGMWAILDHSRP